MKSEDPCPLPFINEVLNTWLDMNSSCSWMVISSIIKSIAPEDKYNIIFITDWGAFVWLVMAFGVKNQSPTYQ